VPDRKTVLVFAALFACFFAVYSIPSPGLGRLFVGVATSLGNAFASGPKRAAALELEFRTERDEPWTAVLDARDPSSGRETRVRINLRKSVYVPLAVFTALALASPIWKGRRGLVVLSAGIGLLFVPIAIWIAAPTVAILYEGAVIDLGPFAQRLIRFAYAVMEPPGMVYAIPFLIWAALVRVTESHPIRFALVKQAAAQRD
jgi:hypothetical protein